MAAAGAVIAVAGGELRVVDLLRPLLGGAVTPGCSGTAGVVSARGSGGGAGVESGASALDSVLTRGRLLGGPEDPWLCKVRRKRRMRLSLEVEPSSSVGAGKVPHIRSLVDEWVEVYRSMNDSPLSRRLPLFTKSEKSKSLYCAGYYIIHFDKGWVKSFCPKLITVERYETRGPFKTDIEMRQALSIANAK